MNNMDTNMEDVVKIPETHQMPQVPLDPPTIPILDSWITSLMECKQLSEIEVQRLCEKVMPSSEVAWLHVARELEADCFVLGSRSPAGGVQCTAGGRCLSDLRSLTSLIKLAEMPRDGLR